MRGYVLVAAVAAVLAGCHSDRVTPSADAMAGIKKIQLQDRTDPLLLQGSGAGFVSDLVMTALKTRGYDPCRSPCQADATASLNVTHYRSYIKYNHMTGESAPASEVVFVFTLDRGAEHVMNLRVKKSEKMPKNDLAVQAVQTLSQYLPPR